MVGYVHRYTAVPSKANKIRKAGKPVSPRRILLLPAIGEIVICYDDRMFLIERNRSMSRADFLRNLDSLLNVPAGTLKGSEPLATVSGWDSLAIVGFLALMDKEFGVNISAKQLGQCRVVNDLVLLTGDHLRN